MTYRFIAAEKVNHAAALLCRVLRVSRSGFYAWCQREPSARAVADHELAGLIATAHADSRGTYGAPRIHAELREAGVRVSRRRIGRLLRELGLEGVSRRRRRRTTIPDPIAAPAPDLVERRFGATGPDRLWFADITYIPTWEGFLYLSVVMDAWSRRIIGWSMRDSLEAELVVDALGMALTRRGRGEDRRPIHHSDRGSQYTSMLMGRTLAESGIVPSMGRRGSALDNAACESVMSTIKCELVNRRSFRSRDEARMACFDYIEAFYNPRRRHSALGYLAPAEFERRHLEASAGPIAAVAAGAIPRALRMALRLRAARPAAAPCRWGALTGATARRPVASAPTACASGGPRVPSRPPALRARRASTSARVARPATWASNGARTAASSAGEWARAGSARTAPSRWRSPT